MCCMIVMLVNNENDVVEKKTMKEIRILIILRNDRKSLDILNRD